MNMAYIATECAIRNLQAEPVQGQIMLLVQVVDRYNYAFWGQALRGKTVPDLAKSPPRRCANEVHARLRWSYIGLNLTSVQSADKSSNTTVTGISTWMSSSEHSTMLVGMRTPSSSCTIAYA